MKVAVLRLAWKATTAWPGRLQLAALCLTLAACSPPGATPAPTAEERHSSTKTPLDVPEYAAPSEMPGARNQLSDAQITASINDALSQEALMMGVEIHVETLAGVVRLTGYAGSLAVSEKASAICRQIAGVREIENALVIST